ncbi:MAG: hypothetical protein JWN66_726 [Sphingomonas bacterium]|jgi:hypothetical protein|uniref:hypothetical protein n=1 Tax=Sphingomonas bacterium TaxID=1895847 RepID=UPI002617E05E|nr:hypothetical protein [Sphingomonas bacterium]MDB5703610.1 hypothetical protein [Sphingomonas bacterium]
MERPRSIVMFERCYLAAFVIGALNTILAWSSTRAQLQQQEAVLGAWFLPAVTLIGFGITLLLWYLIARKGSQFAKWAATVFLVLGLLGLAITLPFGTYPKGINGVLGIVTTAFQAISVWFIFRPDTAEWFGETRKGNAA